MTENSLLLFLLGTLGAGGIIALLAVHNVRLRQRTDVLAARLKETEASRDDLVACLQGMLEREKIMLLREQDMQQEFELLREKLKAKEQESRRATARWMEERAKLLAEMRDKEAILKQQLELRIVEVAARIEKRVRAELEAKSASPRLPSEPPDRP